MPKDEPAFPRTVQQWNDTFKNVDGLTKREYFSAIAMQGLLSHSGDTRNRFFVVEDAVNYSDALIEELNK